MESNPRTSTRRALLLGATAPDLRGVEHDLQLMREALQHHGFTDIRTVTAASRDAIHESLTALIDATEPRDAVVLYYSGHASTLEDHHFEDPECRPCGEASLYRFLVPSDIADSTEHDFRGYTTIELSQALAQLTAKTTNVTAIMDCCHAGRVFRRADGARERIEWQDLSKHQPARHVLLEGMFARSAAAHYRRLRTEQHSERVLHAEANPWAVQLLASDPSKPAFEVEVRSRSTEQPYYAGAMTIALHDALMKVDRHRTTWQDVGRMICSTPQRGSSQHVAVEGPYRRFLFNEDERQPEGELGVELVGEQLRVAGGRLVGLAAGDEVELFSLERGVFSSIGTAPLRAVHSSWAELGPFAKADRLDTSSYARPWRHAAPKAGLTLRGIDETLRAILEARLMNAGLLQLLEPGVPPTLPFAGELRATEDDRIALCAPNGDGVLGLDRPRRLDPARSPRMAAALADHLGKSAQRLARAAMLRALPEPSAREQLQPRWELTVHTIVGDRLAQLLGGGETLPLGTAITATLRSESETTVYCNVLQVRADGMIRLLSRAQGGSAELLAGRSYRLGQLAGDPRACVRGVELEHPRRPSIDAVQATQFDLIVVISEQPVDLRSWEQPGVTRFNPRDPLLPEPVKRNLSAPRRSGGVRYHVEQFRFMLG